MYQAQGDMQGVTHWETQMHHGSPARVGRSSQQPEPGRQKPGRGCSTGRVELFGTLALWDKRRTFTDLPHGTCLLNSSSSRPFSFLHQISADKKTLGRFCGQLGSPLGNPPEAKEFMSEGNKMLLTFHTDFSNEENGTIMFYKGFLAYYQAVGEWSLGAFFPGLSHMD